MRWCCESILMTLLSQRFSFLGAVVTLAPMESPPPIPENEGTTLSAEQKQGRTKLVVVLGAWLCVDLAIGLLLLAFDDPVPYVHFARLVLTAALFYALWKGREWARWLTIGLFAFSCLQVFRELFAKPIVIYLLWNLTLLSIYMAVILVLVRSKTVAAFLSYQRLRK